MRKAAVAIVGGLAALAFAQSAFAANTASISVTHDPFVLAGSKSTTIHISIPQATDPIAAINIYVPAGYALNTSQSAGTKIGAVDATAFSHDANLTLPLSGDVTADNPAAHAADSKACVGSSTSQAVWVLNLSVAGQTIALPLYVNPTAGVETALGAYKLSICLPPPDVPIGTPGRSAQGAQVLDSRFTVSGIFTTPTAAGAGPFAWQALFTPYVPSKGTVNAAGTFYARGFAGVPVNLAASQKKVGKTVQLSGNLTESSVPVTGSIRIAYGTSATKLTKQVTAKAVNGAWKAAIPAGSFFQLNASAAEHDFAAGCSASPLPAAFAPGGCASSKLSAWSVKSAVQKAKK